jgi:hypothetical protein
MSIQQQDELRAIITGLITPVIRPVKILTEPIDDDVAAIVKRHGGTIEPVPAGAKYNTSAGFTEAERSGEWEILKMSGEQAESLLKAL